ncbi:hypothetical protein [Nesterenkonia sp.]|uniref:hypothetical protein n=1 Tax=Nesterenkonia sp. TaxID=704201 RepID=UPI00261972E5|nr:hypothetical protein [Nesterenkonia sp.]
MLKKDGERLLANADAKNLQVAEEKGHEKCRRALQEVADTLDAAEDYRPLLDRAYEIGYEPSWDGGVSFDFKDAPFGIVIGGMPVASLTDVENALSDEEAVKQGYLDEAALALPELEEYRVADTEEGQDGAVQIQPTSASWHQTYPGGGLVEGMHYRWYSNANSHVYGFGVLGGRVVSSRPVFRHILIRRFNYRLSQNNILTAYETRARSRYTLANSGTEYSRFRTSRTSYYQWHSFSQSVVGRAAEMWRSDWRVL